MSEGQQNTNSASITDIDWNRLKAEAFEVSKRAYAPYSNFEVGAAALTDDGRIITGCNVENLSYGLTLCAECAVVSSLHSGGGGRLIAVAVVSGSGQPCTPCGRCRQLLFEHGGPDCLVDGDGTIRTVAELLPGGFDAERLAQG
ncbi:MAG: cytidine deaminase [Acidimicrobiia bacterium]|nr:cytidine deaminase [Acidimicrobiia bacterium]